MNVLRKYRRLPIALPIQVRCENAPNLIPVTVLDVSLGGLGIASSQKFHVGMMIEMQHSDFPCAPTNSTTSKCRVVSVRPANARANGFRIGLAFEKIDMEFGQNLLQWVQMQALLQKKNQPRNRSDNPQWI